MSPYGNPAALVVEDESLLRALLQRSLSRFGFDVIAVDSAESALKELTRNGLHLALLDISLPGMSGVELLEVLMRDHTDVAAIMVSASDELDTALETLRTGAYDYITKPFQEEQLWACVDRAMEKRRLTLENQRHRIRLERLVSKRTRELEQVIGRLSASYDHTIRALGAALDLRDTETEDHCYRVAAYAVRLAEAMGIEDDAMLRDLKWGAYLHDVGKIGIPDSILLKPSRLTPGEYEIIKRHPILGYQMLRRVEFLSGASDVVLHHHENYDGTGYPSRLVGEEIPLLARIFSVADAVDAMTSERPYKAPRSWPEVREELERSSGTQFDADVVNAFLRVGSREWTEIRSQSDRYLGKGGTGSANMLPLLPAVP